MGINRPYFQRFLCAYLERVGRVNPIANTYYIRGGRPPYMWTREQHVEFLRNRYKYNFILWVVFNHQNQSITFINISCTNLPFHGMPNIFSKINSNLNLLSVNVQNLVPMEHIMIIVCVI